VNEKPPLLLFLAYPTLIAILERSNGRLNPTSGVLLSYISGRNTRSTKSLTFNKMQFSNDSSIAISLSAIFRSS